MKNTEHNLLITKCRVSNLLCNVNFKFKSCRQDLEKNSRHLTEFALSVKPESTETKLLKFAINNKVQKEKLPHPIDSLKQLEKDLFPNINNDPINITKIRRKARKLASRINRNGQNPIIKSDDTLKNQTSSSTKWDVQVQQSDEIISRKNDKVYTCKPLNYYTIKDNQIMKLNKSEVEEKPIYNFEKRLDETGIRKQTKFKHYEKGTPSNVNK